MSTVLAALEVASNLRRVHPFGYRRAHSWQEASALTSAPDTMPISGGTDLLVLWKERLVSPGAVVDVTRIPDSAGVTDADGDTLIGAATRVADLAEDPVIVERYPMLARACASVATPALRNAGTIAGNLCQRPRCWYFRRRIPCFKNGGDTCPASTGENQLHAILGGGPCWIVHPSDPAVALTALDAVVSVVGPAGSREVPLTDFYLLPSQRMDSETVLADGEVVSTIRIPGASAGGVQLYEKVMQRGAWDFALVALAAAKRVDGDVRLVLGGVAPVPWRVTASVEEDVSVGGLDDDSLDAIAERALHDARPLAHNSYKVRIASTLLRRAFRELGAVA